MSLSLLNPKANGVCLRLLRMGQQAVCQLLQLEVQVQIKPRDNQKNARAQVLLHAWLAGLFLFRYPSYLTSFFSCLPNSTKMVWAGNNQIVFVNLT